MSTPEASTENNIQQSVEKRSFWRALGWTLISFPAIYSVVVILLPARLTDAWRLSVGLMIAVAVAFAAFEVFRLCASRSIARQFTCPECGSTFTFRMTGHRKRLLGYAYNFACKACGHHNTTFHIGRLREEQL